MPHVHRLWSVGTLSSGALSLQGGIPRSAPGSLTISPTRDSHYVGEEERESGEKRRESEERRGRLGEGGGSGGGGGGGGLGGKRAEKVGREERKVATSQGFSQRSIRERDVGADGHANKCSVVWSSESQRGHKGDGIFPRT